MGAIRSYRLGKEKRGGKRGKGDITDIKKGNKVRHEKKKNKQKTILRWRRVRGRGGQGRR